MLDLLRTRRWITFTALVVGLIVAFGLLSRWQWHRAEERHAERMMLETSQEAPPSQLVPGQAPDAWDPVTVTGTYEANGQVAVRRRPMDATNGFWIMAPLRTDAGDRVWVNRGWMPAVGAATQAPTLPAPPSGEVVVTGWWRDFEPGEATPAGLPTGMITAASSAELPQASWPGFVQRSTSQPDDDLIAIPRATVDESRNVSYALQWALFAAIAIIGWFVFLRREAREDAIKEDPSYED